MRSADRFEPMAWRAGRPRALKPAASIAISISCSWNKRHAEGLGEAALETGCRKVTASTVAPAQVGMDRPSLDRARADEGDLDDEVVEARGRSRGSVAICAGSRPGRSPPSRHGTTCRRRPLPGGSAPGRSRRDGKHDRVDCPVDRLEHAETEKVELHQADRRTVVLVPLEHGAVLHAGPLDRTDLRDGAIADHRASRDGCRGGGESPPARSPPRAHGRESRARPRPRAGPGSLATSSRPGRPSPARFDASRAVRPRLRPPRSTKSSGPYDAAPSGGARCRASPTVRCVSPRRRPALANDREPWRHRARQSGPGSSRRLPPERPVHARNGRRRTG